VSNEARTICRNIRADADRYLRAFLRRLGEPARRPSFLQRYIAGELGGWR
jgi:hypothetical protein